MCYITHITVDTCNTCYIITSSTQTRGNKMNSTRKYDILRTHAGKGLSRMSHQRMVENRAEELVSQYANYDGDSYVLIFSDLPDDEQNELTRLYLDATGRETGECVHGNDFSLDNKYICALLQMLQDNSIESRENFAETTRKNIIIYYEQSLQDLIDRACQSYEHSINNENGIYAHVDMDHGDVVWGRC